MPILDPVDIGILFFIAFLALWIVAFRSRSARKRRSLTRVPQAPRQLTVVGTEDEESAVAAVMAVTGASHEEASARLTNLPTTIWVPAADYESALDVFAESGIAYATGSLGASASPPHVEPAKEPINPPRPPPLETAPGQLTNPPPSDVPPTTDHPGNDPQPAQNDEPTKAAWVRVDPTQATPEVAAALAESDRTSVERSLRRLSMNGNREADVVLGTLLAEWGRQSEAEGLFRSRAHDDPVAANNLGVIDEDEGRGAAARRNYARAAELGSSEGAANLARLT